ncbi:hypothetical protein BH24CHL7_BH24CHL7_01900 [soil metagenome]
MTLRPFLAALLLVALVAPVALVSPTDAATAPFIVMFDDAAVAETATAGGLSAGEVTVRGSAAATGTTTDDDDADVRLRMDPRRVGHKVAQLENRHGLRATNVFGALGGFSANLSTAQRNALAADPTVASIAPDAAISLDEGEVVGNSIAAVRTTTSTKPGQPSGIARVGATKSAVASINGLDQRVNVDVAVLDTGVDAAHPDLNVAGGYNCTSSSRSAWKDKHGHGTHVAGTIGAIDNAIGVVGVAPGARIWSVKVMNDSGDGYASWLVCGVNWVTSQKDPNVASRLRIEVVNMSLLFKLPNYDDRNCGIPSQDSVHLAICRSVDAGVVYAVAAGNEAKNARMYRPAAYDEVITVSAIADYDGKPGGLARQADYCPFYSADGDDTFADFSNYGADVDLTAPGKCVLSTYPGKRYAWMSGTSMATPHVAGAAALYLATYPGARPQQVRMALQHSGRLDWKTGTDRDSYHEKSLWVGSFSPPPFFTMSSGKPSGYLSTGRNISLPITLSRSNGHTAPVTMSLVKAPAGVTLTASTIKGSSGTVTLSVAAGAGAGTFSAKLRASDGELTRGQEISLRIDAQLPVGLFSSPLASATTQAATSVLVSWSESDIGSGLASRTLQRQRAVPSQAGSCTAATWSNDGAARTAKKDYSESLLPGSCYRWRLTLRDNAENVSQATSGTVLVSPLP